MNPATGKYVYGVLAASASIPARPGIADSPLQLISSDGVAALVSEVPRAELRMGRESMTVHAKVLEEAHALATVLPMRFGVVMDGEAEVRAELLEAHRDVLVAQLSDFAGTSELKLRATYEEDVLLREVVREDQDVARLRGSLRGLPEDATYYGRIQLGELIASAIERKRQVDASDMLDTLETLALAVDVGDPAHERIVLNASFLVAQDRIEEFDTAVDGIGRRQADRMRFKYVGPLPPHSFVQFPVEA